MPFEDGSFIYVDYTTKNKDDGKVFETTLEDVAKSAGIYREGDIYGSRLIILGQGWTTKGFEEALKNAELGKEMRVEVPYDKAYGPRDPRKERHYSLRAFEKGEIPKVGSLVEVKGEVGTVLSVGGGRVLIDFNDPRAGKTLVYEFIVREKLEKDEDKIKALVHRRFPGLKRDDIVVVLENSSCTVQLPEAANLMENAPYYKAAAARDINKYFPKIYVVHFIDTYMFKPPQPAQQPAQQSAQQPAQQTEAQSSLQEAQKTHEGSQEEQKSSVPAENPTESQTNSEAQRPKKSRKSDTSKPAT
ncbi:MAG: FKBP-type peptidyl-prolyl cis-trans isomerase [Thermoprotei archaeon]